MILLGLPLDNMGADAAWRLVDRGEVTRRKRPWNSLKTTRSAHGPKNVAFFAASASTFDCRNSRRRIVPRTQTVVAPVVKGPRPRNSSPVSDRGMSASCGFDYGVCGLPVRTGRGSTRGARRTPIARNGPGAPIRLRRNLASRRVAHSRHGERMGCRRPVFGPRSRRYGARADFAR
jgi:hypothetical protein